MFSKTFKQRLNIYFSIKFIKPPFTKQIMVALINKSILEQTVKSNYKKIVILNRCDLVHDFVKSVDFLEEKNTKVREIKNKIFVHLEDKISIQDNVFGLYNQMDSKEYAFAITGILGKEVSPLDLPYSRGMTTLRDLNQSKHKFIVITSCQDPEAVEEAKQFDQMIGYFTKPIDERRLLYVLHCYATGKV